MKTRNTTHGTAQLLSGHGTLVVNFSDPAEGRRLFDRFDRAGFGRHAKYLTYRVAFGVGVVYCDSGCEATLHRFFETLPVSQADRDAYASLHQFDRSGA